MAGVVVTSPQQPVLKSALKKASTLPRPRRRQVVIDEARNTYCEATSFYRAEPPSLPRARRAQPVPVEVPPSSDKGRPTSNSPPDTDSELARLADLQLNTSSDGGRKCPSPQTLVTALLADSLLAITPGNSKRELRQPWRPNLPDLVTESVEDGAVEGSPPSQKRASGEGDTIEEPTEGTERQLSGCSRSVEEAPEKEEGPRSLTDELFQAPAQFSEMFPEVPEPVFIPETDTASEASIDAVSVPGPVEFHVESYEVQAKSHPISAASAPAASAETLAFEDDIVDDDEGTNLDDPDPVDIHFTPSSQLRMTVAGDRDGSPSSNSSVESSDRGTAPLPKKVLSIEPERVVNPPETVDSVGCSGSTAVSPVPSVDDSYSLEDIEDGLLLPSPADHQEQQSLRRSNTGRGAADDDERCAADEELAGFVAGQAARTERLRRRYATVERRRRAEPILNGYPDQNGWSPQENGYQPQGQRLVEERRMNGLEACQPGVRHMSPSEWQHQQQTQQGYHTMPHQYIHQGTRQHHGHQGSQLQQLQGRPVPVPLGQTRQQQLYQIQRLQSQHGVQLPGVTVGFPGQDTQRQLPHGWRSTEWLTSAPHPPSSMQSASPANHQQAAPPSQRAGWSARSSLRVVPGRGSPPPLDQLSAGGWDQMPPHRAASQLSLHPADRRSWLAGGQPPPQSAQGALYPPAHTQSRGHDRWSYGTLPRNYRPSSVAGSASLSQPQCPAVMQWPPTGRYERSAPQNVSVPQLRPAQMAPPERPREATV